MTDKDKTIDITDKLNLDGDQQTGDGEINYNLDQLTDEQREQLHQTITEAIKTMTASLDFSAFRDTLQRAFDTLTTGAFRDTLQELRDSLQPIQDLLDEIDDLRPFLKDELDKEEYGGITLAAIMHDYTPGEILTFRRDPDSFLSKAIEAARAKIAAEQPERLPHIRYKTGTELRTSTDKTAQMFYSLAAPKGKNYIAGQREMLNIQRDDMHAVKYESDTAKAPITLFYDFFPNAEQLDRLGIKGTFDSYDFFIEAALDNLYLEGNEIVSLTKVWHELGNTASPSTAQLTDLYKRIVRGATTIITMDDREVQIAWGNISEKDKYKEVISPLMPAQLYSEKFIANGNVASSQIRITGLSPFFTLSQSIGHYTTWKKEILQLYTGRKTTRYYSVLQYMITQIGWLRNPNSKRSNKITYSSVYEYCGDSTTRSKQLTRDMIYRLLDEIFKPAGYITSYKEDNKGEPGVILTYTANTAALPGKGKKQ